MKTIRALAALLFFACLPALAQSNLGTLPFGSTGSSVDLASPGPIGGTTPGAGSFTTLTTTSTVSTGAAITAPSLTVNSATGITSTGQITSNAALSNSVPAFKVGLAGSSINSGLGADTNGSLALHFQGAVRVNVTGSQVAIPSNFLLGFANSTTLPATMDTGNSRFSAGIIEHNAGTAGTVTAAADRSGGMHRQIRVVTTTASATIYDFTILANMAGGSYTVTLPTCTSANQGQVLNVKKNTTDSNTLTIGRNSSNIEGAAADLTTALTSRPNFQLHCDSATGWWQL